MKDQISSESFHLHKKEILQSVNQTGSMIVQKQYALSTAANISSLLHITPQECFFCCHYGTKRQNLQSMIKDALSIKHATSQNLFYQKHIEAIVKKTKNSIYIEFRYWETWDHDEEENLKRYYQLIEIPSKLKQLSEYYRYHRDVPRIFLYPINQIFNKYHDKMRRIEYHRITGMLNILNNVPQQEKPKVNPIMQDRILGDEFNQPSYCSIFKNEQNFNESSLVSLYQINDDIKNIISQQDGSYSNFQQEERSHRIEEFFADKLYYKPPLEIKKGELIKIFHQFIKKNETRKVENPLLTEKAMKPEILPAITNKQLINNFETKKIDKPQIIKQVQKRIEPPISDVDQFLKEFEIIKADKPTIINEKAQNNNLRPPTTNVGKFIKQYDKPINQQNELHLSKNKQIKQNDPSKIDKPQIIEQADKNTLEENFQSESIFNNFKSKFQLNSIKQIISKQKQIDFDQPHDKEYSPDLDPQIDGGQAQKNLVNKNLVLLSTRRSQQTVSQRHKIFSNNQSQEQNNSIKAILKSHQTQQDFPKNQQTIFKPKTQSQGYQSQSVFFSIQQSSIQSKSNGQIRPLKPSVDRQTVFLDSQRGKSQSYDIFKKVPVTNNRRLIKPGQMQSQQSQNVSSVQRKGSTDKEKSISRSRQMLSCYESAKAVSLLSSNLYNTIQSRRTCTTNIKQSEFKEMMMKQIQKFIKSQNQNVSKYKR